MKVATALIFPSSSSSSFSISFSSISISLTTTLYLLLLFFHGCCCCHCHVCWLRLALVALPFLFKRLLRFRSSFSLVSARSFQSRASARRRQRSTRGGEGDKETMKREKKIGKRLPEKRERERRRTKKYTVYICIF